MKFLFRKYPAKKGEIIEVNLSSPATVKFMTAAEFKKYTGSRTHTYFKGRDADGAIRFALPFDSIWHAVVEQGEDGISATCKLCPPSREENRSGNSSQLGEDAEREMASLSMGSQSEG